MTSRLRPSDTPSDEIVTTRVFDAPRETVFAAFETPQHLAQWWGPAGFSNTIQEFDFRPGGAWRLVMHGPDGANYNNVSEFVEIVRPERIVFQHLSPVHRFRMTMTYAEAGAGKTRLTWRMSFDDPAESEKLRAFIAKANEQNFDRLEALLETLKPKER